LAIALCLIARLTGLALGWLLWQQGLVPVHPASPDQIYLDNPPIAGPISGWTLGVWQRLDTVYYLQIAAHGYSVGYGTVVFPPLYPFLIRLVSGILGGQYLLAALLISTVACVGVLALMADVTAKELDMASARRAVAYLIFFPMAYILIAAYAEPVMLCFVLLTFRWAQQQKWWLAGLAAFLATAARLQAAVLVVPLAYLYLRGCLKAQGVPASPTKVGVPFLRRALRPEIVTLAAPLLAAFGYDLYLASRGLPSVQSEFAQHWYSTLAFPGTDLAVALRLLFTEGLTFPRALSLAMLVLFAALTVVAFRRLPLEYGLYMAGVLLYTLSRHELAGRALLSVSRHVLVLFPGFMVLGSAGQNRWVHRLILGSAFGLYLFLMGVFFMWGYAE
jgi:hypothetical protein